MKMDMYVYIYIYIYTLYIILNHFVVYLQVTQQCKSAILQ